MTVCHIIIACDDMESKNGVNGLSRPIEAGSSLVDICFKVAFVRLDVTRGSIGLLFHVCVLFPQL